MDPLRHPGTVLGFQSLCKTYRQGSKRKVRALHEVSFEVAAGEVFALLGPNGAGKTTLMKIALGLLRPSAGAGVLFGRPLGDLEARRAIGFQPEQPYLYPFLTVEETLRLLAEMSGIPRAGLAAAMARAAADCGLEPVMKTQVRRLSRGWLQRVVLAGALLPDPRLLLLDEPMSGLDPEARVSVKQLIRRLREEGRTVLFSSHILPDVEQLADRLAILRRGELVACGSLDQILCGAVEGYEIELRGRAQPLPGAPLRCVWERPAEGRSLWRLEATDPSALQPLLARWIAAGVEILAVVPQREGLESFVARALKTTEAGRPEASRAPTIAVA
ncbi:MAG: ABC transporter ATP-binding protein [Candidatus Eisenbacteria bacterium]